MCRFKINTLLDYNVFILIKEKKTNKMRLPTYTLPLEKFFEKNDLVDMEDSPG